MGPTGQSVSSHSRGLARTGKLTGTFYSARPGAAVAAADRCVANRRMQRSNAFAFGDFISFDERQKKQKQRKSLCAKGKPGCLLMKDFSRGHPALAKNAARPCAAPSGSADVRGGGGIFRSGRLKTTATATAAAAATPAAAPSPPAPRSSPAPASRTPATAPPAAGR